MLPATPLMLPLRSRFVSHRLALAFFGLFPLPGSHSLSAAEPGRPFLEQHCFDCHDADTQKGNLNLSALKYQPGNPGNFETWVKIHDNVACGEMPPKKKARPLEDKRRAFLSELATKLIATERERSETSGRAVFRRLTRTEYENALKDLLDLPELHVKEMLPADGLRHGFDKVGEALDISHVQLSKYLDAAERALVAATATRATPPPVFQRRLYPTQSFKFHINLTLGSAVLLKDGQPDPLWPVLAERRDSPDLGKIKTPDFSKLQQSVALLTPNLEGWLKSMTFAPIHAGRYKLRLSTWSFQWNAGKIEPATIPQTARLQVGPRTLGYFGAPSMSPTVHEIEPWLEMGDEVIFDPASFLWTGSQIHQRKGGGGAYVGPAVVVDWLEVDGPHFEEWPPRSHQRLYGKLPLEPLNPALGLNAPERVRSRQKLGYGWPQTSQLPPEERESSRLITVSSQNPGSDARQLLAEFLPSAFRRPVSPEEVESYACLVEDRLAKKDCFELAMRHAYRAALTSTQFLFRAETPGRLSALALASRLSFWLWNSQPDAPLLAAAANGSLLEPRVLHAEMERMLKDSRSNRFFEDFLDQWLNLRDIDTTNPDHTLYPEFHRYLKESMLYESRYFFRELIDSNLPASNILHSDFAMLNQRLAEHYGIAGVEGPKIRKVRLPADSHRGGFPTQASVLKVTANGTVSSPVVRGVFFTERFLGLPVPGPPPGITAIDPDTRGTTTVREQLEKHRADASCAACHRKMDPPGLALESYDVIGGWRSEYRSLEKGPPASNRLPDGAKVRYKVGPRVDPSGETSRGETFGDLLGLKALILKKPETVARAFTAQMLAYATGADVGFADRAELDRIVAQTAAGNYRVRDLLHAIAQSRLFLNK
jgi:hypothetical protein